MSDFAYNKRRFYLIPLFFIIHNIEEIIMIKRNNIYYELTGIDFTAFSTAVLLLSAIVVFTFRYSEIFKNGHYFYYVAIGLLSAMFFNLLFSHIGTSIYYKVIAPGLFSSIFLFLPLTIYIFFKDLKSVINRKEIILSLIIGPLILVSLTALLFLGSNEFFNEIIYTDNFDMTLLN